MPLRCRTRPVQWSAASSVAGALGGSLLTDTLAGAKRGIPCSRLRLVAPGQTLTGYFSCIFTRASVLTPVLTGSLGIR